MSTLATTTKRVGIYNGFTKTSRRTSGQSIDPNSASYATIVREYDRNKIVLNFVPPEFDVFLGYSNATIHILGDVCDGAEVRASGGNATIIVHGSVCDGAKLYASGGGAMIKVHGKASRQASIHASGGSATTHVKWTDSSMSHKVEMSYEVLPPAAKKEKVVTPPVPPAAKEPSAFDLAMEEVRAINRRFGIDDFVPQPDKVAVARKSESDWRFILYPAIMARIAIILIGLIVIAALIAL